MGYFFNILASIISIIMVSYIHHWFVYFYGGKYLNRKSRLRFGLSKHFDPLGLLISCFFGFGWKKPLEIKPEFYDYSRLKIFFVSLVPSFLYFMLMLLFLAFSQLFYTSDFFYNAALINAKLLLVSFFCIPPLDLGGFILFALPKNFNKIKLFLVKRGFIILILIFILCEYGLKDNPLQRMSEFLYNIGLDFIVSY